MRCLFLYCGVVFELPEHCQWIGIWGRGNLDRVPSHYAPSLERKNLDYSTSISGPPEEVLAGAMKPERGATILASLENCLSSPFVVQTAQDSAHYTTRVDYARLDVAPADAIESRSQVIAYSDTDPADQLFCAALVPGGTGDAPALSEVLFATETFVDERREPLDGAPLGTTQTDGQVVDLGDIWNDIGLLPVVQEDVGDHDSCSGSYIHILEGLLDCHCGCSGDVHGRRKKEIERQRSLDIERWLKDNYNRPESPDAESTFSALETQLLNMFQRDFLALLGTFHKIDKLGLDVISQEEFRAAVESRFDIEMTDDQFTAFIDRVPLDAEGNVLFYTSKDRGKAKSLYTEATEPRHRPVNALPQNKTPVPSPEEKSPTPEHLDPGEQKNILPDNDDYLAELPTKRTTFELFKIIKELMKKNFQKLQDAFYELDELNTRRLSQETMYHLMKKSAAFPNAKQTPPRRGDSDFLIRSRKLNCAADMLQDNLRAKIKGDGRVSYIEFLKPFALKRQTWRHGNNMLALLQHPNTDAISPQQRNMMGLNEKLRQKLINDWKSLRRAFKKLDVSRQGYLTVSQFRSVLKNANINLDEEEVYQLLSAFDENMTGRIPYNKFLSETFRPMTHQERLTGQADLLF
ncbi:hypothetical protein LSH36_6g11000 [Paralvinella palmiformis]|uniref:EF-hand domain-containing protein n=1 Tax=Paralvinella palmiformis TaxID=53620 RepID=A0AAD9KF20_9ANNE|nr:hypothetical protein LSH36_6g11000 [Paralvinella palmiformis]